MALVSLVLITLEITTRFLEPVRGAVGTVVSPLQFVAEIPYFVSDAAGELFATRTGLLDKNRELNRKVLELSQISQQFLALKAENERFRELLGSQARVPAEVVIAELLAVIPAPNTHQIVVDKGKADGVQVGQAVIDALGLFGQVVQVDQFSSRVLLITDTSHAVPVQVNRNNVRSIAGGTGELDRLELENVPVTADIREGDLIETSGLGGRFLAGYPVGYVESVVTEPTSLFAMVTVVPNAELDRSRHVLIVLADPQRAEAPADEAVEEASVDPAAAETDSDLSLEADGGAP